MGENGEQETGRIGVGSLVLGRYRLDEQVAAGGMGVLWRATDTVLDGVVALKRVSFAHLSADQAASTTDRTMREARMAAKLRGHPHVASLYDVAVDDGDVWLVLEYVPSRSLAQVLAERGTMSPAEVARIGADVADALVAAHALDIQHRDITPANVLIKSDGTVKLTDFGLAQSTGDSRLTQTGAVVGTVAYLAPEVAREGEASRASDIFSLGATMYAAIEGEPPFGRTENPVKMLHIVSNGIIRPPVQAGPLQPMLLRMLALNPATRPDAATIRDWLRRSLEPGDNPAAPIGPPAYQSGPTALRGAASPPPRDVLWSNSPRSWAPTSGSEWATGSQPMSRGRQLVLVAAAVLVVAAVVLTLTTFAGDDRGERAAGGERSTVDTPANPPKVAALPARVGEVGMGDELRTVDVCRLLPARTLQPFGKVRVIRGSALFGCYAEVEHANGSASLVGFEMSEPSDEEGDFSDAGTKHDLGGIQVYQNELQRDDSGTSCHGLVVLSDNSALYTTAYPNRDTDKAPNPCSLVAAVDNGAANQLADGGVPHTGWAGNYSLAARNGCDLVGKRALTKVKNLDFTQYYGEFADWGCKWGVAPEDSSTPAVHLQFMLLTEDEFVSHDEHQPITIDGRQAYQTVVDSEVDENTCTVYLPQQKRPTAEGTFQVVRLKVRVNQPRSQQCEQAQNIATAVQRSLSSSR